MYKRCVTALLVLGAFFHFSSSIFAEGEFSTSLINTQTVSENGQTHVRKEFTLKNNLSTVYITKYGLEVSSNEIENVKVLDHAGKIIPANVVKTDTSTTIGIDFEDKIVGKDKERRFRIEYDDPDAAIVSGNVLEAYMPKVADPEKFDAYTAVLKVPQKFGQPTIANPSNFSLSQDGDFNVLTFANEGKEEGISIIFGEKQYFDFSLNYNLKNPTGNRGVIQIALPPDTPYQKVKYADINPHPSTIEIDGDGNWIATYILEPDQKQVVTAKGIATVHLEPLVEMPAIQPQVQHILPDIFWESEDPIIQNIAQKTSTPKEIFDFVVDSLDYDYNRISSNKDRFGAKASLENSKNAVCQEYTDLFIAVARANKIPARQAVGYAFTNNQQIRPLSLVKDVLHAWPEYYDEEKKLWIPVDPTWTSTTGGVDYFSHLDFNHFVFAYQGLSSERPYPAGSYKNGDEEDKDVFVEVTDHDLELDPELEVTVTQPLTSFFNLFGKHTIKITNDTGQAWYNTAINLEVEAPNTLSLTHTEVERILPYQTIEIPFTVKGIQWIGSHPGSVEITVGEQTSDHKIVVSSRIQQMDIDPFYLMLFVGSFLTTTLTLLVIFYSLRKWRKSRLIKTKI